MIELLKKTYPDIGATEITRERWEYFRKVGREAANDIKPRPQQNTECVPDIDYPEGGAWWIHGYTDFDKGQKKNLFKNVALKAHENGYEWEPQFPYLFYNLKKIEDVKSKKQ